PHHTEGVVEEYRKACDCRKPNTGMIETAARDFGIDLAASFVVGDQLSDIEAGRRAGCRTVLLVPIPTQSGGLARVDNKPGVAEARVLANHIAADLYAAAEWVIGISTAPHS
ncbi:MAG: HAD-IIIA family hydrolase, partial [Chloroflexi bacterium]|nr:HAD-IIIA family hydrolase [Chloroflexota bacterium]